MLAYLKVCPCSTYFMHSIHDHNTATIQQGIEAVNLWLCWNVSSLQFIYIVDTSVLYFTTDDTCVFSLFLNQAQW